MSSWRILLLATACQLLISLLPCAAWPWLLPASEDWSARLAVVSCLAVVLSLALWCETLATQGREDVRTRGRDRELLGAQLSGLLVLLVIWCGLLELGFRSSAVSLPSMICSLFVASAGIGLRSLAIVSLGSEFQTTHCLVGAERLKTTGLYAWMRHPSESGLLLFALGCAQLLQSGVATAIVLILLLPLVIVRLRAEEAVLREMCGTAHEEYCRRTPLLVPKLFGL